MRRVPKPHEYSSYEEGPVTDFNRPVNTPTSVTLPLPLSFFFGALPLPFRRGSS